MVTAPRDEKRTVPAGDAMAVVDTRGTVTGWSEGARLLTGYAAAEVTGRPAAELVDGDDKDAAEIWRELREGAAVVPVRHRDGRRVELALRACPVQGEQPGYVITASPDEWQRTLGDLAFQQAAMSMSVFDTGQRYLRMNEEACRVMGEPWEAFRHRYFPDTLEDAEHNRGFLRHLEIVVETGQPVRYESWARSPSSRRMHAWNTEMWPVRDHSGELIGTALAAFDSSEQFWARQRLALLNEAAETIGTKLDVIRTAQQLAELVVPRLADFASVDLLDSVLEGEEPTPGAVDTEVELRRVAHHSPTPGYRRPRSVWARRTSIRPSRRPPARWPRVTWCSPGPAPRISTDGSRGTTPVRPSCARRTAATSR